MNGAPLILVVDDDADLRAVVCFALGRAGFRTIEAPHGAAALESWRAHGPNLLVLDILMPELDGTEVCRQIRRTSEVPIIFLSSRDEEIDRVLGLELGGDDYITKPFSPRELVARVKAVLRRLERPAPPAAAPTSTVMTLGRLRLDLDRREATWDQTPVVLTVTEFELLRTLMARPGRVFTRDELIDRAYDGLTVISDRTVDSHITRIRRKFAPLEGHPIETVHGVGYRCGQCLE